ncbi:hypothetical protein ACQKLP_12200 [Chitinophaga sp. NPDC101104]|uniref:hypothetical protein n=1 Tax=Chitinophaga sp. NPDC101104 TaxID=3390561 RepID=UPI003D005A0C
MNYYDHFAEWLFSPERSTQQKTIITLIGIAAIFFTNDLLGLSYYYVMQRKTEHFTKLTAIINAPATDSTSKSLAFEIRKEIIEREPYSFFLFDLLKGNSPSSQDNHQKKPTVPNAMKYAENISIKNQMLFIASSGGIYFISSFITFLMLFFGFKKLLSGYLILIFPLIITIQFAAGSALAFFCSFIPNFSNDTGWNYLFNFLLQLSTLFVSYPLIIKLIHHHKKRR